MRNALGIAEPGEAAGPFSATRREKENDRARTRGRYGSRWPGIRLLVTFWRARFDIWSGRLLPTVGDFIKFFEAQVESGAKWVSGPNSNFPNVFGWDGGAELDGRAGCVDRSKWAIQELLKMCGLRFSYIYI